jgi:lipopolysaccharide/colanic/teichoic acid biosynthesis glycosyltransferase
MQTTLGTESPFAPHTFIGWSDVWHSRSRQVQLLTKRLLDVVCAVVLLAVFLPVLLLVALLVRTTSSGPILYRQRRVGRGGRHFWFLKFRTMYHHSDPSVHLAYYRDLVRGEARPVRGLYKLVDDARVTGIGRILRRLSLDELPQLINILRGDMSLVGPRPPIPYEADLYTARDWARLSVMPGLTGLWQVSGRGTLTFQEMVDLDLQYIERWSLWLDWRILLRTPLVVLTGKGAC